MHTCVLCPRQFTRKDSLKRHINTVSATKHFRNNQRMHTCALCLQLFTRKDSLKRHMNTVHDQVNVSSAKHYQNSQRIDPFTPIVVTVTLNLS